MASHLIKTSTFGYQGRNFGFQHKKLKLHGIFFARKMNTKGLTNILLFHVLWHTTYVFDDQFEVIWSCLLMGCLFFYTWMGQGTKFNHDFCRMFDPPQPLNFIGVNASFAQCPHGSSIRFYWYNKFSFLITLKHNCNLVLGTSILVIIYS